MRSTGRRSAPRSRPRSMRSPRRSAPAATPPASRPAATGCSVPPPRRPGSLSGASRFLITTAERPHHRRVEHARNCAAAAPDARPRATALDDKQGPSDARLAWKAALARRDASDGGGPPWLALVRKPDELGVERKDPLPAFGGRLVRLAEPQP